LAVALNTLFELLGLFLLTKHRAQVETPSRSGKNYLCEDPTTKADYFHTVDFWPRDSAIVASGNTNQ